MKASDLTPETNLSFLFKGPWGHGKTLAAASFVVGGPIWIAYFDKKKPVELTHYFKDIVKRPELLNNIEYDVYSANNAHEYLNKLMQLSKDCRYFAVITDSVTNLTAAAVNWSMGFRAKTPKKDKINSEAMQMIPDWDEYKVETSLVSQALDISRTLPCHIIWTAHPLPGIKIEGTGAAAKVNKVTSIVTYGSKTAGLIPGNFTEIYHFSKSVDYSSGKSKTRYLVNTEAIGDDYAKTALDLPLEIDMTDNLFYAVWRDSVRKEPPNELVIDTTGTTKITVPVISLGPAGTPAKKPWE